MPPDMPGWRWLDLARATEAGFWEHQRPFDGLWMILRQAQDDRRICWVVPRRAQDDPSRSSGCAGEIFGWPIERPSTRLVD